jgi:hypothetical protein
MSRFLILNEHHELASSLGVLLSNNCKSSPLDNTILHFDSHSDVGHIKSPRPLSPKFIPSQSDLLSYLNVGNPFTLLYYYGLISDFYWFSPGDICHEICQPFVFSVEHEWNDPIHFYRRKLTSCLDSIFETRELNTPTYRKVSIDSDDNLYFLTESIDYALLDTGLREVMRGNRGFVLDICFDYFYTNPDHIASPMKISITEQFYHDFCSDPLHPLKLRLGPIARVTHDTTGYKLDIGGFQPTQSDIFSDTAQMLLVIDSRLAYFEKFLRLLKSPPQFIYLCRSSISNYTPKSCISYIESKVVDLLENLQFFGT